MIFNFSMLSAIFSFNFYCKLYIQNRQIRDVVEEIFITFPQLSTPHPSFGIRAQSNNTYDIQQHNPSCIFLAHILDYTKCISYKDCLI